MIPNAKCGSMFFAGAVVMLHRLFDVLQGAYESHMERAQMRLAPVTPRSWRDIPRAGAQKDCYRW
jgi:hypothetical protein